MFPDEIFLLLGNFCGIDERRQIARALGWDPASFIGKVRFQRTKFERRLARKQSRRSFISYPGQKVSILIQLPVRNLTQRDILPIKLWYELDIITSHGEMAIHVEQHDTDDHFDRRGPYEWFQWAYHHPLPCSYNQMNQTSKQLRESLSNP